MNLLRDVVELANEVDLEFNKLFFIIVIFSFTSNDKSVWIDISFTSNNKSVWIDFVKLLLKDNWSINDCFSLRIDSTILSSSSSSSSIVPSSLMVIEGRGWVTKGCCSCWSWCKINDTLSIKSASIVSGAKNRENKLKISGF